MALIDVIKFEGDPKTFAWKHPSDELRLGTQVVVNESQEVVLFKSGQALDRLGPGRHTLETKNIPLLRKVVNIPFGGQSPFKAEIWFVNKVHSLAIKWGTPSPIQIQDPKYRVFIPVRSFGQFGIQVEDSRKFLTQLVGTMNSFTAETLTEYFKGLYITKVKDNISQYIVKKNVSILHINSYLDEISEFIKQKIEKTFENYGIRIINFYINDINVPEDDPAVVKLKTALAKKAEMDIVGYSYTQERSFDTLQKVADNPGSEQSGVMGAGIGMGMGMGLGGSIGGQFGAMAGNFDVAGSKTAPTMMAGVGVSADGGADNTSKFSNIIGRPVVIAEKLLAKAGFKNEYSLEYITDNGEPMSNPAKWSVTSITVDDENKMLLIDVKSR